MSTMKMVIGGGGNPVTTSLRLFEAGLNLTGAGRPNILLIPTPKDKPDTYAKSVANMTAFGQERGLQVRALHGFGEVPTVERTAEFLTWAHAVYVTGGNTRYMLQQWAAGGITATMIDAVIRGLVTTIGISAGMVAWFRTVCSDWPSYEVPEGTAWSYTRLDGLDVFKPMACAHLDSNHPLTGVPRLVSFMHMINRRVGSLGLGLDESVGLQIVGAVATVIGTGVAGTLHRFEVEPGGSIRCNRFVPGNEEYPLASFVG